MFKTLLSLFSSTPGPGAAADGWSAPTNRPGKYENWRILFPSTIVEGAQHRHRDVMHFVDRVQRASNFGIQLVREPNNPHDKNALRVDGWIGQPAAATTLGYISRGLAAELASVPHQLAGSLKRIYCRGKYIEIQVDILEPRAAPKPRADGLLAKAEGGGDTGPGTVEGSHFTSYVEAVKALKREKRFDEAVALLNRLVEATEADARANKYAPAPWYYDQLAMLYRKRKDPAAELAVLERYAAFAPGVGVRGGRLRARLAELRTKNGV